jgi:hypothetical protein
MVTLELKISYDQLKGLNIIWNYADLYRDEITGLKKAMPSLLLRIATKLKQKEFVKSLCKKTDKPFKLSLAPFEAVFLEEYIRTIICSIPPGYERSTALSLANSINQKLT